MSARALFLDRDGVINEDNAYVGKREDFRFLPGIFELVRTARQLEYLPIVITNQAGIGRGYYSEEDFAHLTRWMLEEFVKNSALVEQVYFCPHHPKNGVGKYKKDCPDRKPNPGMLLRAQEDFGIDLAHSILIGDKRSDIEAGRRAGVGTLLFLRSNYPYKPEADVAVIASLGAAATFL